MTLLYIVLGLALIVLRNYFVDVWAVTLEEHNFRWPALIIRNFALLAGIAFLLYGIILSFQRYYY